MGRYTEGFTQCVDEVSSYLTKCPNLTNEVQNRLVNHLHECIPPPKADLRNNIFSVGEGPSSEPFTLSTPSRITPADSTMIDINNNQIVPQIMNIGDLNKNGRTDHIILNAAPKTVVSSSTVQTSALNLSTTSSTETSVSTTSRIQPMLPQVPLSVIPQTLTTATNTVVGANIQDLPIVPLQLIPVKLPSGDVVYLMMNSQNVPGLAAATQVSSTKTSAASSASSSSVIAVVNPQVPNNSQTIKPANSAETKQFKTVLKPQVKVEPVVDSTTNIVSTHSNLQQSNSQLTVPLPYPVSALNQLPIVGSSVLPQKPQVSHQASGLSLLSSAAALSDPRPSLPSPLSLEVKEPEAIQLNAEEDVWRPWNFKGAK